MRLLIECDYLHYILNPRASKNKKLNTFLKQKGITKNYRFCKTSFEGNKYRIVITKSCLVKITCDV